MTYNKRMTDELNRRFGLSDRRRGIARMRLDDARALRIVDAVLCALTGAIVACVVQLTVGG